MRIAIDLGHTPTSGAVGSNLREHAAASVIGSYLAEYLCNRHTVEIIDFPHLSNSGDLSAAARAVNAGKFDLCVSLHCDHDATPTPHGAHVCYTSEAGKKYAVAIASHLCPIMPGRADLIVRRPNLHILRATNCPAVLVECGFLSNPTDAALLTHEPHRIARAIAAGIFDAGRS